MRLQSTGTLDRLDRADAMHGVPGLSKPASEPPPSRCSVTPELCLGFPRPGYVLTLTQSLCAHKNPAPRLLTRPRRAAPCRPIEKLPCSSARFEDGAVLRSFFSRADGSAIRGGSFLEMGAYDGNTESTTRFFEGCLGAGRGDAEPLQASGRAAPLHAQLAPGGVRASRLGQSASH